MTKVRQVMREIRDNLGKSNAYLEYDIHGNAPYTYVHLQLRNTTFHGSGFSKCNPIDTFDTARGVTIAEGRAIKDLADGIVRMGLTFEEAYKVAKMKV